MIFGLRFLHLIIALCIVSGVTLVLNIFAAQSNTYEQMVPMTLTKSSSQGKRVLLVTYGRTGSSYTGELISSIKNSLYFFEPSYPLIPDKSLNKNPEHQMKLLEGLFYCDNATYEYIRDKALVLQSTVNEPTKQHCNNASLVLIKTIRVRLDVYLDWILDNPDIKILLLVRDPRGIVASAPSHWGNSNPERLCKRMRNDLRLYDLLPLERSKLIRYEDLVDDVYNMTRTILQFLELQWSAEVDRYIEEHSKPHYHTKESSEDIDSDTFRGKNFSTSHRWKDLPMEKLQHIENHCKDVMASLSYDLVTGRVPIP